MKKNNYIEKFRKRNLLPFEKSVFDKVISLIPKRGNILDLGCGNGYPYADNLFVQPQNRCLNYNKKYENTRYNVQIKWYALFDDILENLYYKNNRTV